jgi:hypothetical protein
MKTKKVRLSPFTLQPQTDELYQSLMIDDYEILVE